MKATQQLHDLGQSLWLDNITRALLTSGTLRRYIRELAVRGLTSNPTVFDHALENSDFHDDAIRKKARTERTTPELEGAGEPPLEHDSSTNALFRRYRRFKKGR